MTYIRWKKILKSRYESVVFHKFKDQGGCNNAKIIAYLSEEDTNIVGVRSVWNRNGVIFSDKGEYCD